MVQQNLIVCAIQVTWASFAKKFSFVKHPLALIHMFALNHTKDLNVNVHMELQEKIVIESVTA